MVESVLKEKVGIKERLTKMFFDLLGMSAIRHSKELARLQEEHNLHEFRIYKVIITDTRFAPRYIQPMEGGQFRVFTGDGEEVQFDKEALMTFKTMMNIGRGNIDPEYAYKKGLIRIRSPQAESYSEMRYTGDVLLVLAMLKVLLREVHGPFRRAL